ncbi:MAG: HAMP domain-containing sensor histidine kinase [Candidatus Nitrosotenuis sp.]|jgi:signal transduction histidine kinase
MKVQKKILLGFLVIIAIVASNGIIGLLKVEKSLSSIEIDVKSNVDGLKDTSHLNRLTIFMRYYDEVLTQAARNYAFTSDEKWSEIYLATEPKLDRAIKEAIKTDQQENSVFTKMDQTNGVLLSLEHQAMDLVKEGKSSDALALLDSEQYWDAKKTYNDLLTAYAKDKGMDFNQTIDASTTEIDQSVSKIRNLLFETQLVLYVGIPVLIVIAITLSYFISRSISRPIKLLNRAAEKISQGDYDVKFEPKNDDEVGELGQKFESMMISFRNSLETERKLAIAQERLKTEKLTAIGELAARMAHDLRNPLSVIKNVTDLIRMQYPKDDARLQDHFTKLENSIRRMSHQIDDVLNFVRSTPLEKKITSLREIITKSIEDLNLPSSVKIDLPPNDEKIDCDEQQIRTAFSNIILNAAQAMDEKGTISIKIAGYTKHVIIEITDSGPGIQEDILPYIFDPLFTTKQRGTGLGLSSCKNIITQHGGTISAKNNPTTFTINLPRI